MSIRHKSELGLAFITLGWGASYILCDIALKEVGPLTLNAVRFILSFLVAGLLMHKRLLKVNAVTLKYGIIIGLMLSGIYALANFGLLYTSLSNAGFLCTLPCVFAPIFGWLINGNRIGRRYVVIIMMCLVGTALLTLEGDFRPELGDILCLGCSVAYGADVAYTESAVRNEGVDALNLGILQLGFGGVFSLILAVIFEEPTLPQTGEGWLSVLFLSIMCTGVAFIMQNVCQQYTDATRVGIIFTLEPIFAGVLAFFVAGEVLSSRGYIGAALMIGSVIIMELGED